MHESKVEEIAQIIYRINDGVSEKYSNHKMMKKHRLQVQKS